MSNLLHEAATPVCVTAMYDTADAAAIEASTQDQSSAFYTQAKAVAWGEEDLEAVQTGQLPARYSQFCQKLSVCERLLNVSRLQAHMRSIGDVGIAHDWRCTFMG